MEQLVTIRNFKRIDLDDLYRQVNLKAKGSNVHSLWGDGAGIIHSWITILRDNIHLYKPSGRPTLRKAGITYMNEASQRLAANGVYLRFRK